MAGQESPILGPLPPVSSNKPFQQLVTKISQALFESKFEEAKSLALVAPKSSVTVTANYNGIPEGKLSGYSSGVVKGIKAWDNAFPGLTVTYVESANADILITFVDKLPESAETGLPEPSVDFFGYDPAAARLESVIGMRRLKQEIYIEESHVASEVMYAIGSYLGADRSLFGSGARGDSLAISRPIVPPLVKITARENIDLSEKLRSYASKKTRVMPAKTSIFIDAKTLTIGKVTQGDQPQQQFSVFNNGNAPLSFRIVPDCSCFTIVHKTVVPAGGSTTVQVTMNTTDFVGSQLKNLFIYSNDASQERIVLPITADIEAAYWFESLSPEVIYADQSGTKAKIRLVVAPTQDIRPHTVKVAGLTGAVDYKPWEGIATDPLTGKQIEAKGYEMDILIAPLPRPGRTQGTVQVTTNNELFKTLNFNLTFQQGIAVLPQVLYFGEIGSATSSAWAIISQPLKPFHITDIHVDHEHLTASFEKIKEDEYKILVNYDGKSSTGLLHAIVTIKTNDPENPEIKLPVQGIVR